MSRLTSVPAGSLDYTGTVFGTVQVIKLAQANPTRKWFVRCDRCGSQWTEDQAILSGRLAAKQLLDCRNWNCRLDRIPDVKISEHEKWLNSQDQPPIPEPVAVQKAAPVEKPSVEYLRYKDFALGNHWKQVLTWDQWKKLPARGKEFLFEGIDREE